ncbi:conserved hypothetical protein [Methylomarinovum caldicuralii]|uniref:DUF1318 domain-containing protein n=1 Tax=Methylomarinovum caldicuralii TaxID=438856 RepID=A0AAU9BSQ1_9GAMM|nr:YdbL family protein [Methylomarinovum caldicuralii]BCX81918.1 conserved hypothetical protein [Methylomarinovum caldicuralii]
MKKTLTPLIPLLLMLGIAACVTINIYFPAAAAEKAADRIIKEIQEGTEKENPPQSALPHWQVRIDLWALLGVGSVQAAADLDIDSPEIRAIRASMKRRFPKLKSYLDRGWIGYANNGLVAVVNKTQIPLKERAIVERLVAAENRDRLALYRAIARANGHPEWADDIQATFAKRWIANAKPGWQVQLANGRWVRK